MIIIIIMFIRPKHKPTYHTEKQYDNKKNSKKISINITEYSLLSQSCRLRYLRNICAYIGPIFRYTNNLYI